MADDPQGSIEIQVVRDTGDGNLVIRAQAEGNVVAGVMSKQAAQELAQELLANTT